MSEYEPQPADTDLLDLREISARLIALQVLLVSKGVIEKGEFESVCALVRQNMDQKIAAQVEQWRAEHKDLDDQMRELAMMLTGSIPLKEDPNP